MIYSTQRSPSQPSAKVNFLAATKVIKLAGMYADGLAGLSPRLIRRHASKDEQRDLIINKFFESGSIEKKMFSLYFKSDDKISKMLIGGYDEQCIEERGTKRNPDNAADANDLTKSDDGIFWMYINSDFFWQVDLYEAKIGPVTVFEVGQIGNLLFNSAASVNYLP